MASYVTIGTASTLLLSGIPICCYFSSNKSTCFIRYCSRDLLDAHLTNYVELVGNKFLQSGQLC